MTFPPNHDRTWGDVIDLRPRLTRKALEAIDAEPPAVVLIPVYDLPWYDDKPVTGVPPGPRGEGPPRPSPQQGDQR